VLTYVRELSATRPRPSLPVAPALRPNEDRTAHPAAAAQAAFDGLTCPLCHTVHHAASSVAVRAGEFWLCTRCGQLWTERRLETVAAYGRFVAARGRA
jgi:hypothetical protein